MRVPRNGVVGFSVCLNNNNCVINVSAMNISVTLLMKSGCFEPVPRTPEQELQWFDRSDIGQAFKQKLNLFVVSGRLQNWWFKSLFGIRLCEAFYELLFEFFPLLIQLSHFFPVPLQAFGDSILILLVFSVDICQELFCLCSGDVFTALILVNLLKDGFVFFLQTVFGVLFNKFSKTIDKRFVGFFVHFLNTFQHIFSVFWEAFDDNGNLW